MILVDDGNSNLLIEEISKSDINESKDDNYKTNTPSIKEESKQESYSITNKNNSQNNTLEIKSMCCLSII